MKALALPVLAASLLLTTTAFADSGHHPGNAAPQAPQDSAKMIQRMQDNAAKMQAQIAAIANAKSDDERRAAMSEHMQTMQENMQLAQGAQGGMMMACPMHQGGMPMMGHAGEPDTRARMHQMEQRMDMMQMMMQRMMGPGAGNSMQMK